MDNDSSINYDKVHPLMTFNRTNDIDDEPK